MRLTYNTHGAWKVIDARTGLPLEEVMWVDDDYDTVGIVAQPLQVVDDELVVETWHVPKVVFLWSQRTALVNVDEDHYPLFKEVEAGIDAPFLVPVPAPAPA